MALAAASAIFTATDIPPETMGDGRLAERVCAKLPTESQKHFPALSLSALNGGEVSRAAASNEVDGAGNAFQVSHRNMVLSVFVLTSLRRKSVLRERSR